MSELTKLMKERRSIRNFKPDEVSRELIDAVIEAGEYAASGHGKQASRIIAVTNKEMRDRIADENRRIGGWQEGFDPFYGAPVILLVIADKEVPTAVYDGSLTIGNMLLKAHELGLGSIWIHRAKEEMESPFGAELLKAAGLDGEFIGVGHVALGWTDGDNPPVIPRKEGRVFYID